jgi:endonuclease YncB( thermonuclease family)
MKNLLGQLLLAFMAVSCSVNPLQESLSPILSDETLATVGDADTIQCNKNPQNIIGATLHGKEIIMAKSGCQLHLYPCGTCSRKDGPGAILIQDDCSQSCQKCGN